MKKFLTIALVLVASLSLQAQKLVILHTNDTHSHLDPQRNGTGGIIERAAFVDSVRRAEGRRNVLLLHGGDFNQGTSYFTVLNGDLEASLVNAMGYDCITLGNHEFDNGIEDLARRLKTLRCKVVCCNYDFSPFELGRYVKPYTIVRRGGMKIGIVGALCDITKVVSSETSSRIPKFDTLTEINRWSKYLKEEKHCDMVILLSHMGYDGKLSDCALAPEMPDVDLIVGGHSHTMLKEMDTEHGVPIVQDGGWGTRMGVVKVY